MVQKLFHMDEAIGTASYFYLKSEISHLTLEIIFVQEVIITFKKTLTLYYIFNSFNKKTFLDL